MTVPGGVESEAAVVVGSVDPELPEEQPATSGTAVARAMNAATKVTREVFPGLLSEWEKRINRENTGPGERGTSAKVVEPRRRAFATARYCHCHA